MTFSQVVNEVMRQLEGAYALIFKSPHYPNELVACKRGSTLILGVKVSKKDHVFLLLFGLCTLIKISGIMFIHLLFMVSSKVFFCNFFLEMRE